MRLAVALVWFACVVSSVQASEYDIYYLFSPDARGSVDQTLGRGQTFQMGKSGALEQIIVTANVYNGGQGMGTLKLYELSGNETSGSPLTSIAASTALITGGTVPNNYTFTFQNLNFPAGKKLAFALFGNNSISIGLGGDGPPNSSPIVVDDGKIVFTARTASFATVITPVPEPSGFALGLVAAVAIVSRNKKKLQEPYPNSHS